MSEIEFTSIDVGFSYRGWTIYKIEDKTGCFNQKFTLLYFRKGETQAEIHVPVSYTFMKDDKLEGIIKGMIDGKEGINSIK